MRNNSQAVVAFFIVASNWVFAMTCFPIKFER